MNNPAGLAVIILTTLGTIFFLTMAFGLMPWNYAIFAGVVCFILAGAVRRFMAQSK